MTWSFFRTVGASGLFLVALYASVQLIGEGQLGNFGTRRLREVKGRQLAIADCTGLHGNWQIAAADAVQMVQTGATFTVTFIADPSMGTWNGEVTGEDCSGYIDFADSGGVQTFTTSSGVMTFASGAEWTEPSGSEVPAATPTPTVAATPTPTVVATPTPTEVTGPVGVSATYSQSTIYDNAYCDTDAFATVFGTATAVLAGSDNGVTNCAARANDAATLHPLGSMDDEVTGFTGFGGPAPGFILYASAVFERGAEAGAANYDCALCTHGVPVPIAASDWAISFYLNDALNTPGPTPQPPQVPTPEPTPLPPGATDSPTPQPTIAPTPQPTLQPTPQPTLQPTPQPTPQPTLMPTMVGETYAPTPPPTPEPTYTPAPTTDVTGGAGWTMYDQTYCPVEWGNIWTNFNTIVVTEYECMEMLEAAMQTDGTTMAAMVTTNVGEDDSGNPQMLCILCEDHASDLIDVETLTSGQWFHMWVYNSAAATPSPPDTATPAPTPGHYPNHYVHSEATPCEENLTPNECEKLVQLYAHTPTIPGEAPFSVVNNGLIPTGCNFQPSGNILLYNSHQSGGGYDILPTGELMLMCKTEDMNARHVYIKNKHGLCLDAKDRRDRAGVVHMWPCDQMGKKDDTNKNQHWDYHKQTGQIKSHDGICLDASERSDNGGQVWMWPCETNNKNQQWSYDPDTMQVMSRFGYCLDARQRKTRGGLVHMWKCMPGNKNQEWLFTNQIMDYESAMDYTENILEYGSWMGDDAVN